MDDDFGNFDSADPLERYNAHQRAKGRNSIPVTLDERVPRGTAIGITPDGETVIFRIPDDPPAGGCVAELASPDPMYEPAESRAARRYAQAVIANQAATLPADRNIGPTGSRFNPTLEDQIGHARQLLHSSVRAASRAAERLLALAPEDQQAQDAATALGLWEMATDPKGVRPGPRGRFLVRDQP